MGSLGGPAIPKSTGVLATSKRYVGHIGLDTNSGTHPGPSRTCAPFAPTMSVRSLGHFLPFPIFLARRILWSVPWCTPESWTNGPRMVCSLCTLVPMTHTPRGRTKAPTHKGLCQGFGTSEYDSGYHHVMAHGDLWEPSTCGPTLDPIGPDTELSVPSPSHHGGIPLGILSILAHFWVCQNTAF